MNGSTAYNQAKKYTDQSLQGLGSIKGSNCTIKSTTEVEGGTEIVFEWVGNDGITQTDVIFVENGVSITNINIDSDNHLICTLANGITIDAGEINVGTSINDTETRTDSTYSSSKISTELNKILNTSKLYTLNEISRISSTSYKVVESISEMTDTQYIYLLANGDTYDMYIYESDIQQATKIGDTNVNMLAENTAYNNYNYPQYTDVDKALNALFNKVYYVKPTCSLSADKKGGTFEIGTVISAPITFTWSTNKDITSQTLTGCTLADESVRTATYNTDVTSNKTFTLSVSDGENSASSSVSYSFLNKIHWGGCAEPTTYDSTFILGLTNSKLASSNKGSYNFNAGSGEYCYFATPSSMKVTSAWVNGFQADLEEVATNISHTNVSGYTTNFTITRFKNAGLGSFSATVQ